MGGPGSGSWYRWSKKDVVEECREIDARRWQKEGFFGTSPRCISWVWYRDGEQIAAISALTSHSEAKLSYSCWRNGDEDNKRSVDYTVPVSWLHATSGESAPGSCVRGSLTGVPAIGGWRRCT